jgi:hypothetical protein
LDWNQYFRMLKDWKLLPAYKVEPRIDSIIGYYLPMFISDFLKIKVIGIIPELPIRLGTVKPDHEGSSYADRSYKVDFLLVGDNDINYLVEFKTDSKSRREDQDTYLLEAKKVGTKGIIEGIMKISQVSSYKPKYNHLKEKLRLIGLINPEGKYTGLNQALDIIYVQPSNHKNEKSVIDFHWMANWFKSNYPGAEFENELADALDIWAKD